MLLAIPLARAQIDSIVDLGYAQYQGTVDKKNGALNAGLRKIPARVFSIYTNYKSSGLRVCLPMGESTCTPP